MLAGIGAIITLNKEAFNICIYSISFRPAGVVEKVLLENSSHLMTEFKAEHLLAPLKVHMGKNSKITYKVHDKSFLIHI